ncbi:MAG: iron(III) transport system ATP-binding protein [Parasphingorhabdus sp.]|jgi:iron(III) transport system ATP-binding protein
MSKEHNPEPTQNKSLLLEVEGVSIGFENKQVIVDAGFKLARGEIGCLLGPSGCGKSTLLRCIAGFETPDHGSIRMAGQELFSEQQFVNPELRRIGMVFQDFALFPHLDVAANIAFGLRQLSRKEIVERVNELLELVGLMGFQTRYPHSLSGGEQQRVALARAMAPRPPLLLLDEAFSNLDVELRQALVPEVRRILIQEGISAILVTHDQSEAFAIADQVGVMSQGKILQWNDAYRLYHEPACRFVANFVGEGDFLVATVLDESSVETSLGVHKNDEPHGFEMGQRVELLVRPDDVLHDDDSPFTGEIVYKSFRGSHFLYHVRLVGDQRVMCFADSHHNHNVGEGIGIRPNLEHLVLFAAD